MTEADIDLALEQVEGDAVYDAGFDYRLDGPAGTADFTVVLLHGSGRDENDLLAFARAVFTNAVLYALRGAVPWESGFAFFRRTPDRRLDVDDLKAQTARLCTFMDFVIEQTGQRPFVIGYSNGAIIAAEMLCQDCSLVQGAILLRPLSPRRNEDLPSLTTPFPSCWSLPATMNGASLTMHRIWPTNSSRPAQMFVSELWMGVTAGRKTQPMKNFRVSGSPHSARLTD